MWSPPPRTSGSGLTIIAATVPRSGRPRPSIQFKAAQQRPEPPAARAPCPRSPSWTDHGNALRRYDLGISATRRSRWQKYTQFEAERRGHDAGTGADLDQARTLASE